MTDLTEKWKKGKLEFGKEYYVRFEDGEISTAQWCYYTNQDRYGFDVDDIVEVLAPVPSYKKWYKLNQLLGKCYRFLRLTETKVEAIEKVKRGLVKEIDEVLE